MSRPSRVRFRAFLIKPVDVYNGQTVTGMPFIIKEKGVPDSSPCLMTGISSGKNKMKKVSSEEILPNDLYSLKRAELRKNIISIKKDRSINLGPLLRIVFENHATVLFQIQEMLLVEGIIHPSKIQEEIDTYNELLPNPEELSAVLFIEITSEDKVRETLDRLIGLDRQPSVHLVFPSARISAIFESDRSDDSKMSSVHYIRFPLGNQGASLLKNLREDEKVFLLADHPAYSAMIQLPQPLISSLRSDLD